MPVRLNLRRLVATVAAGATLVGAGGLVAASPALAAANTLTVTAPSNALANNEGGTFTLTGTSTSPTVTYTTANSTLQLVGDGINTTGESSATFADDLGTNLSATISTDKATAALLDQGVYDVVAAGATGTAQTTTCFMCLNVVGNPQTFTSFVISANPSNEATQIGQGSAARAFVLTGAHFTKGSKLTVPTAAAGAPCSGVVLTNLAVVSSTQITGMIAAGSAATVGSCGLLATQPSQGTAGNFTAPVTVSAAPTLSMGTSTGPANSTSSANAARVPAGETKTVTFTGTNLQSGVKLTSGTTGVTVGTVTYASATSLSAPVTVAAGTAPAYVPVTVLNPDGGTSVTATTAAGAVLAAVAARPTVTSTSPTLTAGTTTSLVITGTNFLDTTNVHPAITFPDDTAGDLSVVSGSVVVNSATQITVMVKVAAKPATTSYQVAVTNPDSASASTTADGPTGVCSTPCVNVANFVLTAISPQNSSNTGTKAVTLTGSTFSTADTYSLILTPSGGATAAQPAITSPATYVSTTSLTSTVNVDAAEQSAYVVSIATSDSPPRTATCPSSTSTCVFNIADATPAVTSTSPVKIVPGQSETVTLTGSNFTHGSTLMPAGTGLTITNFVVNSSTSATGTVTAAANATTGTAHALTIATADSTPKTATAGTITVVPAPTLSSVPPTAVTAGGAAPATPNGSFTVTNPATGETFDGAAGDGGKLAVALTLTGVTGLTPSTVHVVDSSGTAVTFMSVAGGGVTGSFPAASYAAGNTATPVNYTLTLDKTVAAGTLTVAAVLSEAGTNNTYSPKSATTTVSAEPAAPTITGVTYTAKQSATVAYSAPSSTGGLPITSYRLSVLLSTAPAGTTPTYFYSSSASATSITATGLVGGATYNVTVSASNDTGTTRNYGAESSPSPATPYDVPAAPTNVTAANAAAQISWTAGATNGSNISDYMVTATDSAAGSTPVTQDTKSTTTNYTFTGLTNGDTYTFTVTAINAAGAGPASAASSPFTVQAISTPPTITNVSAGNTNAVVTYAAPSDNGGSAISDYQVTATTVPASGAGTSTTQDAGATTMPYTFTGLTNGTAYSFTVTATNTAGTSAASAPSSVVIPATVPGAPGTPTATAGNAQATVSFTAPTDNGGSAVTSYTVTAAPGGAMLTIPAPASGSTSPITATVMGLTNGTAYTFMVTASNASTAPGTSTATGTGSPSAASTPAVTPATVPGQPTAVMATAGDTTAAVTWTAPSSTGGSAITDYSVTATPSTGPPILEDTKSTTTSYSFTGLANGTSYTFTVTASNATTTPGSSTALGSGPASSASPSVTPAGKPTAPTGVTATPFDGKATVSWTAPSTANGSPITDYSVTAIPATGAVTTNDTKSTNTSYSFTGLTDNVAYTFTVTATNAPGTSTGTGSSPASAASSAVTPIPAPPAPTAVMATRGDMSAAVTWTAGTPAVATTSYQVTAKPTTGASLVQNSTTTSLTFTGLTNGVPYTFTVVAVNGSGSSPASAPSAPVTPAGKPTAPTNVTANGGNANATMTWTASSPNGDPITSYTVTAAPGGANTTVMAPSGSTTVPTTATVTGLTNGVSYTFTVTATNSVGTGVASTASNAVTPNTVPSAPTSVVAKASGTSATVTWTAPTTTGGSAITTYTVTASSGQTVTVAEPAGGTAATFTGLTYGTSYTFTVKATNGSGTGATSAPSNAIVPTAVPGTPAAPTVTAANGTITASFTAPAANGSPIISYTATASPVSGGAVVSTTGSGSPLTLTGLTNGVSYVVSIVATNAAGSSQPSPPSVPIAPVAPVAPIITPSGPATVTLAESRTFTTFGQQATLSGVVSQGGVLVPGTPVTLTVTYTDGKVVRLGTVTSGTNGAYSLKYTPIYNGTIVASALGAKSKGVLAKVVVIFTKITATAKGGVLTVKASTAPGFLTGANRNERAQILLVDGSGRQLKVLGIVNAAQRHGAAGQAHGVNDISFTTKSLAAGSYRIEVKVIGTPVNTGAASKSVAVHLA